MKESFFAFETDVPDLKALVKEFWTVKSKRLQTWYWAQRRNDDVVISASPEFLLGPIAEQLGVSLIASRVDPLSGVFTGENCHEEEKLVRFQQVYPGARIDSFYSDSLSDLPLARTAEKAFIVNGRRVAKWNVERNLVTVLYWDWKMTFAIDEKVAVGKWQIKDFHAGKSQSQVHLYQDYEDGWNFGGELL